MANAAPCGSQAGEPVADAAGFGSQADEPVADAAAFVTITTRKGGSEACADPVGALAAECNGRAEAADVQPGACCHAGPARQQQPGGREQGADTDMAEQDAGCNGLQA